MKTTWSWWGRHGIGVVFSRRLCHACTAHVLRLWRCYDAWLTTFATPPRSHRVLTAFQVRSPNLGVCFEHAQNKRRDSAIIGDHGDHSTMSGVSTTLIPRWCTSHTGGIIRAYCYGIEKNGDHVKIRKNRRFTTFLAKVAHVPLRYGTYQYVKRSKRVTRCIPPAFKCNKPITNRPIAVKC